MIKVLLALIFLSILLIICAAGMAYSITSILFERSGEGEEFQQYIKRELKNFIGK